MGLYYNESPDGGEIERGAGFAPTARTKVRRRAGRGRYDRASVEAILDEGLIGHVGFAADGQPYAIPMLFARADDVLYLHGSPLSRLLGALARGVPLCFTVTLLDGLVLARSAFHHSVNYRSVVVLGHGRAVGDREEKRAALRAIVEHASPGRSDEVRGPSDSELDATEVIAIPLVEASVKVRAGPPIDAPEDYALPVWAGELPFSQAVGEPLTDPRCTAPGPRYVRECGRRHA
jgi:uncharacterized protein